MGLYPTDIFLPILKMGAVNPQTMSQSELKINIKIVVADIVLSSLEL